MNKRNEIPDLKILTRNCGGIDPTSIEEYKQSGGYTSLATALRRTPSQIIAELMKSNLRGRGGAGFPTGIKMEAVLNNEIQPKYLVCNADEGEPGNFKDKYLLEHDPHQLIEGMIIGGYAIGAAKGYIYIRGEYDKAIRLIDRAIEQARQSRFLGENILGSSFSFDIDIKSGAGAYVCGEEFALIESLEGKAGRPRNKPPYPTVSGINNKPTHISNVETFSNFPYIIREGGEKYASIGTPTSSGTRLISLSGNVTRRGVFEVPFGVTIRQIIEDLGGGVPEGRNILMVQLGGASGPCIPPDMLDLRLDYKELADLGLSMGSGAVIVVDDRFDVLKIVQLNMRFFNHESCGKCTPCREGIRQILRILHRFINGTASENDRELLESICNVLSMTAFCGLGQAAPACILTTMRFFPEVYTAGIQSRARRFVV